MACRILVIDDEPMVRDVTQMSLSRAGYDVLTAADGQAALTLFESRARDVDAVLLDLTLPGISGEDVFHRLRARQPELPVIVTSGHGEEAMAHRLNDPPATYYLQKPFSPRRAIEVLRNVFGLTPA